MISLKKWDVWGVIIGVVGVVVAVYTFYATDKVGRLSFISDTQKVFDPANLTGFSLVDNSNVAIKQPVFATDFAVWNSGDLSLSENSDRVREPLKISVDGTLHYFIVNKYNIVPAENFKLSISDDKKTLSITWRFFDPGQGIRLTVVHSQSDKLAVSGRFFETTLVKQQTATKSDHSSGASISGVILGGSLAMLFFSAFLVWRSRRRGESAPGYAIPIALAGLVNLSTSGFAVWQLIFPGGPPV